MAEPSTFGQRVRQARRELSAARGQDVTQSDVARELGVSYVTVSRWEKNSKEPDLETIRRLARVLNASPAWLAFGYEGESGWVGETGAPKAVQKMSRKNTPEPPAIRGYPALRGGPVPDPDEAPAEDRTKKKGA